MFSLPLQRFSPGGAKPLRRLRLWRCKHHLAEARVKYRSLRRCGFFLCRLFDWGGSGRNSSPRCVLASQIRYASLALDSYPQLLSHGISMD